jgi:phospholipid/cholesterol/gamma-HCH transport system ATP-binding protein
MATDKSPASPPEPPQETVALELENVCKRFGDVDVLRGVSFRVRRGETLCILGGSGGGKTTLLKILIGALRPTSGKVVIGGEDTALLGERELDRVRHKLGVMFQSGALFNSMSIAENLALPLQYHTRLDADTISTMVKIKLQQVDLLHAADRKPGEISGGMKKRAAVARALALDPRILFYDEPSAGLDPIATSRIDHLINQLKASMKMTNVVVTHVMESVRRIADRVVMLHRGEVLLDGSLDDLLSSEEPLVRQFVRGDLEGLAVGSTPMARYHKDLLM